MLNPFAIEKESLAKVAAIQSHIIDLRVAFSKHVLADEKNLNKGLKEELESFITVNTPKPDRFKCKICGKDFNDGRKLGGHVSRAHKKDSLKMKV